MRMIATLGTVFLLAAFASTASAQIDLDSLLGELTFGESSLVSDNDEATDSPSDTELLPAPAGAAAAGPQLPPAEPATLPVNPGPPLPDSVLDQRLQNPPSAAIVEPLTQAPAPPVLSQGSELPKVNFNEMFQQQQAIPTDAAMTTPHQAGCNCTACLQAGSSTLTSVRHAHAGHSGHARLAGHHGGGACDAPYECRPHMRPDLPPPSTLRQYFNSRNANSNLWSGYEREAQQREDHYYQHVRGECDCFKERKKCLIQRPSPALYRSAAAPRCDDCQKTGCDCQHH